ncbi:MAG: DUF4349 domain-containing protein [Pedobacter sp.]|nr:DUF4349 domain-containing protein [Chitinophagaceae bacterium]
MRKISKLIICFTALVITFSSCKQNEAESASPMALSLQKKGEKKEEKNNIQQSKEQFDRKVINEGEIHFKSGNVELTRKSLFTNVKALNGYVSEDRVSNENDKLEYHITVRVPANNFDKLLQCVSKNAVEIESKNITALDVTEEFIDIEARLKTKKELENRYILLLSRANKVEEILSVEKELGILRGDIESTEGRLKYLNSKIEFSTLTIFFYDKNDSSFNLISKVSDGLQNGWKIFLWIIVAIFNIWPFILIVIGIITIIKWKKRKNKKNVT